MLSKTRSISQLTFKFTHKFSSLSSFALIDTQEFLTRKSKSKDLCINLTKSFIQFGGAAIKDPRVPLADWEQFQFMLEWYFEHRARQYYSGNKTKLDCLPGYDHYTGLVPDQILAQSEDSGKGSNGNKPEAEAHWRCTWKVGGNPIEPVSNKPEHVPLIPKDFPHWKANMDKWGYNMMEVTNTICEMLAIGLEMPERTFTDILTYGSHIMVPSGIDLAKHHVGDVLAKPHKDMCFMTLHGRPKFPGLILKGQKDIPIDIPEGWLFVNAGSQLETLSDKLIKAPVHEILYRKETQESVEKAKNNGLSTWRIGSPLYTNVRENVPVQPMPALIKKSKLNEEKEE